jgi:hypothetical protein
LRYFPLCGLGFFAKAALLEEFGPELGKPHVDTLQGSKYPNMKELRFKAVDGVWRVAFAFDPLRRAIILVAGDKSGVSQKRFYNRTGCCFADGKSHRSSFIDINSSNSGDGRGIEVSS